MHTVHCVFWSNSLCLKAVLTNSISANKTQLNEPTKRLCDCMCRDLLCYRISATLLYFNIMDCGAEHLSLVEIYTVAGLEVEEVVQSSQNNLIDENQLFVTSASSLFHDSWGNRISSRAVNHNRGNLKRATWVGGCLNSAYSAHRAMRTSFLNPQEHLHYPVKLM